MPDPSERPDFTGVWRFHTGKSSLQIPVPESSRFEIVHKDPHFRLTRTLVYGGNPNTISFELTVGGPESVQTFHGIEAHMRLNWEGRDLVFDTVLRTADDEGINVVRYSLSDDRQTFVAVERVRSSKHQHDNTWVFDREG